MKNDNFNFRINTVIQICNNVFISKTLKQQKVGMLKFRIKINGRSCFGACEKFIFNILANIVIQMKGYNYKLYGSIRRARSKTSRLWPCDPMKLFDFKSLSSIGNNFKWFIKFALFEIILSCYHSIFEFLPCEEIWDF